MEFDPTVPLHNIEAEMGVLGSMLLSLRALEHCASLLEEGDFYRPAHRILFRAMQDLNHDGQPVDLVTLKDRLIATGQWENVGGEEYLVHVAEFVPSPANATYYAGIVLDRSRLRKLKDAAHGILGLISDPDAGDADEKIDRAEQLVFDVGERQSMQYFQSTDTLTSEFFTQVDLIFRTQKPITGQKVGFYALDDVTTGFSPGDLVIIGARPGMGKTSLVLDFAINVARQIVREERVGSVAFFSLEMSAVQLVGRMVSMVAGVQNKRLRQEKPLTEDEYVKLADAADALYDLPIYIDDNAELSPLEMRGKCRRLKQDKGLTMVVIDYLQLMRGSRRTDNRVNEISEIARSCKRMAKELGVPVIALSQLSRNVENRGGDRKPQLSDLRESGSIEADADLVLLLSRKEYYDPSDEMRHDPDYVQEVMLDVAKNRHGETRTVKIGFQGAYTRYRNLARAEDAGGY
ncbi:MAG: replicative DNA helicase [Fimbriimonadaceae bacterium]|nr:replicative DNA helicase [Fimbriimonadaceae bacterium]